MFQSGKVHSGMKVDGKRVDIGQYSLLQLICEAYDVNTYQVSGPQWLLEDMGATHQRFDIVANLPDGAKPGQVPEMLQDLLAERFKLVVHKEPEEQSVYALVAGRGGFKLKPAEAPKPAEGEAKPGVAGSNTLSINTAKGGTREVSDGAGKMRKTVPSPDGKSMRFEMTGFTLAELAEELTPLLDH